VTPPGRAKVEPLRDIPGLRKRERTWRDEVQERVRSRRQKRADPGLPLFDQPEVSAPAEPPPPPAPRQPVPATAPLERPAAVLGGRGVPPPDEAEFARAAISEGELADLPLHDRPAPPREARPVPERTLPSLEEDAFIPEAEEEPPVEIAPPPAETAPVERPAFAGERAQAAAVDAALLAGLFALVVYFAGRAARADLVALRPGWPWIAGYLVLLGLFYATYFTGTTGQTPGKILTRLRVVGVTGRPPGYARALVRALTGGLGVALAGLGLLPMAFDPARRAMHDRLLHTRVVRH